MRLVFVGDSLTEGRPGSSYVAVLRQKLPGHTLVNLGRGNDTVISLYRRLAGKPMANYLPRSVLRVAFDALTLRHNTQIDRVAASRGLHVTLDGIHLNSVGANLVADLFLQAIRQTEENQ